MSPKHLRRRGGGAQGFTLIELLIVVAIIGIIAAIAIPNLLNALDKGKQKRTMSDMRTICTAIEAYATDNSLYPKNATTWAALKANVDPYFIKSPPDADGWSTPWETTTSALGLDYSFVSLGKDSTSGTRTGGRTTDFNCDIVFYTGQFFQWPEGTQT
ncbi:MAG TPA: type II secretion system protein GspG [Candidatus Polarisedimenticolia bacterium]|nr:type II secretion system protein GspG [Candidatus Polarisedimenticolia bacterium]